MGIIILGLTLIVGVLGDGEVIFLSKPPNIEFRGHELNLDSNILKDICSTSLGFTTYQTSDWPGLYITSPFNFAQAIVVLSVQGVTSLGISDGHKFPFLTDSPLSETFATVESKILDRYPYGDNQTLVDINLEDDVKAAEITLNKGSIQLKRPAVTFLKEQEDEDSNFISQIALLKGVLDKIQKNGVRTGGLPDLYWFELKGLHAIIDLYGESSNTAAEATELVISAAQQMKAVFDDVYQNKSLFMVITSDSVHTRRFRRETQDIDRNLAPVYNENYPVFFNIFFWFTIAFIMVIIATSMVTACMDPGRDSIIYRMTSTRMKKDN